MRELTFSKALPTDIPEIYAQVFEVWPHGATPESHLALRLESKQHQGADWFVLKEGSKILSSLGTYSYHFMGPLGLKECRLIGAVFTPAAQRCQGLAARLLKEVLAHWHTKGIADYFLYSDIGESYYEKLGFRALPSYEWEWAIPHPINGPIPTVVETIMNPKLELFHWGFSPSKEESKWLWEKPNYGVRAHIYEGCHPPLYLRSQIDDQGIYQLLDTNWAYEAHTWKALRTFITYDATLRGADRARGYWTSPTPDSHLIDPCIKPRSKEILMHLNLHGAYPTEDYKKPFRAALGDHV